MCTIVYTRTEGVMNENPVKTSIIQPSFSTVGSEMASAESSDSDESDDPFDLIDVIREDTDDDVGDISHDNDGDLPAGGKQSPPQQPSTSTSSDPVEHLDKPFHPQSNHKCRFKTYGNRRRSFQSKWCNQWKWLHYSMASDAAYCFTCCKANRAGHLQGVGCRDDSFISKGFGNWKKATSTFPIHEKSVCHRVAVEKLSHKSEIGEQLSDLHLKAKANKRAMLLKILGSLRFLARQSIPTRGNYVENEGEVNSNFIQLLKLRGEDDPCLVKWLEKKKEKYTSVDMQNEMLQAMALGILREIVENIRPHWFSLMADETTDVSNVEQLVICIRWVDDHLNVHEDVIGLHSLDTVTADEICQVLQDVLLRMNLRLENCRGQNYDGASNMSGKNKGVATQIQNIEPRALYTHCYGHTLNLACQDSVKNCILMKDTLDTVQDITKLIKKSPRRNRIFENIQVDTNLGSKGIRILCPTRWTVKCETLKSIQDNYKSLQETWEKAKAVATDTETKGRIIGAEYKMSTFPFWFGMHLGILTFGHCDNLSRSLQRSDLSAAEGQELARMTVTTLEGLRNDQSFDSFWKLVLKKKHNYDVDDPELPRRRKRPARYEPGSAEAHFHDDPKGFFRQIFYEVLDLLTAGIRSRFDQPGYKVYSCLHRLLLGLCKGPDSSVESEAREVCEVYGDDLCENRLADQVRVFISNRPDQLSETSSVADVIKYIQTLSAPKRDFFCEIVKVTKLLLTMPATNAESERSFSALRRVKTWLRSTMTQQRLNHVMILHIHKDMIDKLDLKRVAQDFTDKNERRKNVFGKF